MTWTYDNDPTGTPRDSVRLLIPDTDVQNQLITDEEIAYLLSTNSNDPRLAAAEGLEIVASNAALVLKVTKLLDVSVDGTKVADALMKRAAQLRTQAEEDEVPFAIAELVVDHSTAWERLYKETQRHG